jgi:glyoxylase-like metal-dependent hydrolase (beta-lactamase superfamily II)
VLAAKDTAMARRIWSIEGNSQKLDGGAMFGNAPRALWSRWIEPDDRGRIPLACRALLVREENRLVLFEAGIGAFFEPRLRDRYGVQETEHVLLDSLREAGVSADDIDVVVLSHMHFDHAGGLLHPYAEGEPPRLCFPKAHFVIGREAFARAKQPHPRDRASFIDGLVGLLEQSGRLELVDSDRSRRLGKRYTMHFSHGHTPGLMMTEIEADDGPIVFVSDLAPGRPWVHLPITMGYDRYPELLIDEKRALFERLEADRGRLFFTHDADVAMARLQRDERGRFSPGESWPRLQDHPIAS